LEFVAAATDPGPLEVVSGRSPDLRSHTLAGYDWRRLGTVREAVVTVIGDHLGVHGRGLSLETDLVDLGSEEVDVYEILMTMEELFDIRFDRSVFERVRTVGEVVHLVEEATPSANSQ
jgi:acyl carrier protein